MSEATYPRHPRTAKVQMRKISLPVHRPQTSCQLCTMRRFESYYLQYPRSTNSTTHVVKRLPPITRTHLLRYHFGVCSALLYFCLEKRGHRGSFLVHPLERRRLQAFPLEASSSVVSCGERHVVGIGNLRACKTGASILYDRRVLQRIPSQQCHFSVHLISCSAILWHSRRDHKYYGRYYIMAQMQAHLARLCGLIKVELKQLYPLLGLALSLVTVADPATSPKLVQSSLAKKRKNTLTTYISSAASRYGLQCRKLHPLVDMHAPAAFCKDWWRYIILEGNICQLCPT